MDSTVLRLLLLLENWKYLGYLTWMIRNGDLSLTASKPEVPTEVVPPPASPWASPSSAWHEAHRSLITAVARLPGDSAGLLWDSRSAFGGQCPASTKDFRGSSEAYTLHPYGVIGPLPSSDLPVTLSRPIVTPLSRIHVTASVPRTRGSAASFQGCGVVLVRHPLSSAGSPHHGFADRPQGSVRPCSQYSALDPPFRQRHHGTGACLPQAPVRHQSHVLHRSLCPFSTS
ncbi:unnamed protein product [Leuciscus chuanchicus]